MSSSFKQGMTTPAVVLLLILVGVIAAQSVAYQRIAAALPTSVATVDIEKVFDQVKEDSSAFQELSSVVTGLQSEMDARAADVDLLEEELNAYAPQSEKFKQTDQKLQMQTLNYRAYVEYAQWKHDAQYGLALRRVYQRIKDAAETMAIEEGYDIVFMDDSVTGIPLGGRDETRAQISARRMLYTNPEIDITEQLIARMNAP